MKNSLKFAFFAFFFAVSLVSTQSLKADESFDINQILTCKDCGVLSCKDCGLDINQIFVCKDCGGKK